MEQTKINTNETEFKIIKDKKDEPDLQSAQLFVGGYVECIQFPNGDLLLVNEEGKLMNMPLNPEATTLWRAQSIVTGKQIVEPIVNLAHLFCL
jgi:hypothetical protein